MIDLTPVFNAVIALAAALATAFLIPWIRSKTTAEQRDELLIWVDIAVAAAEQIFTGSGEGDKKKEYVLKFLEERGFKVDFETLNMLIELAVKELKDEVGA